MYWIVLFYKASSPGLCNFFDFLVARVFVVGKRGKVCLVQRGR